MTHTADSIHTREYLDGWMDAGHDLARWPMDVVQDMVREYRLNADTPDDEEYAAGYSKRVSDRRRFLHTNTLGPAWLNRTSTKTIRAMGAEHEDTHCHDCGSHIDTSNGACDCCPPSWTMGA